MSCCLRVTLLLILFVDRSAAGCNPVSEFEDRNVTTTTSNMIVYQLPSCPPLYHLNNIIDAQLSNPSTTSQPNTLNITDHLNVCVRQNATSCSVDIPPQGLNVQGGNTVLNVKVRYTCQLAVPGWLTGSLIQNKAVEVSNTTSVKYIRVNMVSSPMVWNCTVSSLRGSPVTWNWTSRNGAVTTFGCFSYNRAVVDLPVDKDSWQNCLEPQSIGRIVFVEDKFRGLQSEGIVIDLQVPLDSDFDITCSAQPPALNTNINQQPDEMESDCSQMDWATRPLLSDLPSTTSPSKGTTQRQGTTTVTETPVEGDKKTDEQTGYTTPLASMVISSKGLASGVSLGLGIGLGLGLLLVLAAAIVIAIVCVRRKNRDFDASTSNLEKPRAEVGGAIEDKDGGFVLANDIFTVHNIYSDVYDAQREETTEIGYGNESSPPAVMSPPSGDRQPKRATTLSRELFKQIAVIAKQEELRSQQGSVEGEARGRPDGECSAGGQGESQTSLVDRWLYSSTLNSAENTLNQNSKDGDGVYINRRFEMDI